MLFGIEIQSTVYYIWIITAALLAFIFVVNRQLKKFDPMDEPKGLVLLAFIGYRYIYNKIKAETNSKIANELGPYFLSVMLYVFFSNIAGLFALDCPTSSFSVTLTLAGITCVLIEVYIFKYRGAKGYVKSLFEPMAPFVIINVISKISTLASLSLRLFGNILSGSLIMQVVYQLLSMVSGMIPVVGEFNFLGVIVCPALHFYFDIFSGGMQTYLFTTLSITFIGKDLPKEAKEEVG